ncbi:type II secretion system protein L (GspL) [Alteromonadaceae bacterium Bs31]|nr:type II secretion system protein L (GspL) [Alteromonadaceae bacterium Bs31]
MAEKVFARQTYDGLWQWREASDGVWSSDVYHTGDDEALAEMLRANSAPVTLLLAGQNVMSCEVELESKEKRHMAKLLPFELEEKLIDDVEDVHLAYLSGDGNTVKVLYCANKDVESALQPLIDLNCDVRYIQPDYLGLRTENNGVTLVWDGDQIMVRLQENAGFTVDASLAELVIRGQSQALDFAVTVNLVAETEQHIQQMRNWLPAQWTEEEGPEIKQELAGFWDWLDPLGSHKSLNMRRGNYSRQLPIQRWAGAWKIPAIAMAIAYLVAVVVAYSEYQSAKSEQQKIVATMNEVYMQAVPNGRPGDPEGRLKALVKKDQGGGSEPTNLLLLINGVADLVKAANITVSSFRYNSEQRELLLNIEGGDFTQLEALRNNVEKKGFASELLRVESRGDRTSARMKVAEASQ